MPPFRSLLLVSLATLTLSAAQAPAPTSAPAQSASTPIPQTVPTSTVLHTNANLVLVDVVVTDHGNPVQGLDRSRFHILEDGHEQTISTFEAHHSAPTPSHPQSPAPLPPHTFTNIPTYPDTQTVNVLLLDGLNTLLPDQMRVRQQMFQYMGNLQPGTPMAIFTLSSRLRMIKGFTTDPAQLTRALESRKATPQNSVILDPQADEDLDTALGNMASIGASGSSIAGMQQFLADITAFQTDQRVRMTLDAMQQLARYLAGIPGRKNVIWFSGAFPIALDPDPTLQSPFQAMRGYADDVRDTASLLAAARVAVYPVDARGLMGLPSMDVSKSSPSTNLMTATSMGGRGAPRTTSTINRPNFARDDSRFMHQTEAEQASMRLIAEQTGGQEYINTNGLKEAVAKAVNDGASYYTIGYAPSTATDDGAFHNIQVLTDTGGYKLAYRRGYYADSPGKSSAHTLANASLVAAAMLPGAPPATQIRFTARVLPSSDPLLKDARTPDSPAGEEAAQLKGPLQRYIVDLRVDPRWLNFEKAADGAQKTAVEFVIVAYDNESRRVNHIDKGFQFNIKPDQFVSTMSSGIPVRLAIDLPLGEFALRIAVHDLTAARAGSLEIPLKVAAN